MTPANWIIHILLVPVAAQLNSQICTKGYQQQGGLYATGMFMHQVAAT
ncbi:MAG: hypothetical protein JSU03_08505 [Bacteroidetes bacterium]|nr:hypothetical protein [Bacteroidota bacterium]MBS1757304.1 hypothetical protein [Bacteroidota bacterium]